MRINYRYATKLNGQTIKYAQGKPYYILVSLSGGRDLVLNHHDEVIHDTAWELSTATKQCSRLIKEYENGKPLRRGKVKS